jgi:putative ABC transport system substrate-binding protein
VIGYFHPGSPDTSAPYVTAFRQGLGEAGYVEGQNLAIEFRWAEGHYDRLPALAADLVGRNVDVIVANGGAPPPLAAKAATSTIPILFITGSDPVADGLVASLGRPGGNLTGISLMVTELSAKRLDLVAKVVPQAQTIALVVNPNSPDAAPTIQDAQEARAPGGCSSLSSKPAPTTRWTPRSRPLTNSMPARLLSATTRYSFSGASTSWLWHHAMPFPRFIFSANLPRSAA